MTTTAHTLVDSPVGPLTVVLDGSGSLTAIHMRDARHGPNPALIGPRDDRAGEAVAAQLGEYFEGQRRMFDLPLTPAGTEFQLRVWEGLRRIPYGATLTYGALAAELGLPHAARAVGAAIGRNPLAIVVPCHRVVGTGGSLTGYAGGLERKRYLLSLEGALPGAQSARR